jgi:hypothetical protein
LQQNIVAVQTGIIYRSKPSGEPVVFLSHGCTGHMLIADMRTLKKHATPTLAVSISGPAILHRRESMPDTLTSLPSMAASPLHLSPSTSAITSGIKTPPQFQHKAHGEEEG